MGSTIGLLGAGSAFIGAVAFAFMSNDRTAFVTEPLPEKLSTAGGTEPALTRPSAEPDRRAAIGQREKRVLGTPAKALPNPAGHFTICHTGGGVNCVVDGDTLWIDGMKVRIADIDAPETHPPRCDYEAELGNKATLRLQELMNAGPFELRVPDRATDRYGRALRVVVRDQQSIGEQLVTEGLARSWGGSRQPWC